MYKGFEISASERPNMLGVGLLDAQPAERDGSLDAEDTDDERNLPLGAGRLRGDARRKSADEDEDFEEDEFENEEDEFEEEESVDDDFDDEEFDDDDDLDDDLDDDADDEDDA